MILERGTLLNNRYRIVEILGQGGMGSVYRAIDENLGVEVAVKDNLFTTEEYARQFRREAIILANLRHSNLPRVTDHFVINNQGQYLVMDYIEGEDLRQRMDRVGLVPEEDVILIGAAVCDALTYLASCKPAIIHRDIKPGNVKITPQGHIYLVDFGLAKTMQGSQATTTGARAMTPGYSPPEQYGTARTDQRSDIFSLGATLYSALTGATPEDALARAMDQAVLTSIRKHNPRVSRRLASVLERALETRPENRFQSPDEFKQALLSASSASRRREGDYVIPPAPEESRPIPTENPLVSPDVNNRGPKASSQFFPISTHLDEDNLESPRSRTQKRRSGRGCSIILGIILLVALGAWAYVTFLDPDLPARVSANIPFMIVPVTPVSTVSGSLSSTATTAPETPTPAATFTATLEPTLLPTSTATLIPTVTPTPLPTAIGGGGGQVAFASDSTGLTQIYVINTDGTRRKQVTDLSEGACQPSWSPDGKRLVFISPCTYNTDYYPGSAMYIINVDGTGLLPLPTVTGGDYDPAWSPDGNWIAFTSLRNSGRPQIYLQNLVDNSVLSLSEKFATDFQPAWSSDGKKLVFISTRRGSPQVWMMDIDGKNQFQFSQSPNYIYSRPSWSPDRTHVVFTQLLVSGGIPRVSIAPVESESYTEFRVGPDSMPMRDAVYSPDGFWLVFEAWQAGKSHDLYLITSNGAGLTQLTEDPRTDFDVAWNPASPSPEQP